MPVVDLVSKPPSLAISLYLLINFFKESRFTLFVTASSIISKRLSDEACLYSRSLCRRSSSVAHAFCDSSSLASVRFSACMSFSSVLAAVLQEVSLSIPFWAISFAFSWIPCVLSRCAFSSLNCSVLAVVLSPSSSLSCLNCASLAVVCSLSSSLQCLKVRLEGLLRECYFFPRINFHRLEVRLKSPFCR